MAAALSDPDQRTEALHGIVNGWNQADPAGLTKFLVQLPADPQRPQMLGQALQQWAQVDPAAASEWVANNELGRDMDDSIAAVASGAFLKPDEAASWAGGITNPQLRSETLLTVLRNWSIAEPEVARRFFATTRDLLPAEREQAVGFFIGEPAP